MLAFIPGTLHAHPGPLARYLPPIPDGAVSAWLQENVEAGSWLIEPFGAAPHIVIEAANAGYKILVAANNPITRFLIELYAAPASIAEFRAVLAEIAASQRAGERLEPQIRALYRSTCEQCGEEIEVQAYIWERSQPNLSGKLYVCAGCKAEGEFPANAADIENAARFSASGLHRARALERVLPLDDPDRPYVEEALGMYTPRSLYALFSLVNKLEGLNIERRKIFGALLLSVFDQANVLWSYPISRSRPRQLTKYNRYLEKNIWLALEGAIDEWWITAQTSSGIPLSKWPDLPRGETGICIYEGRLKELTEIFNSHAQTGLNFQAAIAAVPRPNQAYWTFSVLWAGWLWGNLASRSFRIALHRRRYDWGWETEALFSGFSRLTRLINRDSLCLGLMTEVEPGLLSAAVLSAELAGLDLDGMAIHTSDDQGIIQWHRGLPTENRGEYYRASSQQARLEICRKAAIEVLNNRGEPSPYLVLHSSMLQGLAKSHQIPEYSIKTPAELPHKIEEAFLSTLGQPGNFSHFAGSSRSPEAGLWWLGEKEEKAFSEKASLPLADRIEIETVNYLIKETPVLLHQLERYLCEIFPGLLTPEQELILECLSSYTDLSNAGEEKWFLRPEDRPISRRADMAALRITLKNIGGKFGFRVIDEDYQPDASPIRQAVKWFDSNDKPIYVFYIIASAVLGNILPVASAAHHRILVLPGGRSRLVSYKLGRDPRLQNFLDQGWKILKYRHIRWLAEYEGLMHVNLDALLDRDPLESRDPQMRLL